MNVFDQEHLAGYPEGYAMGNLLLPMMDFAV
jgi:hypothetical protein